MTSSSRTVSVFNPQSISKSTRRFSTSSTTKTTLNKHKIETDSYLSLSHKRKRELSPIQRQKKSSQKEIIIWKLMIGLYDEDFRKDTSFKCYYEDSIFPKEVSECLFNKFSAENDCQTEENHISICSDYISFQLEQAILKAEINA